MKSYKVLLFSIILGTGITVSYAQDKQDTIESVKTNQEDNREDVIIELDLDKIDEGLNDLEEVQPPSELMVAATRVLSPMVAFFINCYDRASNGLGSLKESIWGKNMCCRCHNKHYKTH